MVVDHELSTTAIRFWQNILTAQRVKPQRKEPRRYYGIWDYYKFLCPALPEMREFIREKIKSYCEVEGLNEIAIDYNRLVDVVPSYHVKRAALRYCARPGIAAWDYGYPAMLSKKFKSVYGYDPREQKAHPSADIKWRQPCLRPR